MTLIPAIMIFLTFNNPLHKSKSAVYRKFNNEQFDLNRALGQFGASAVQIASFVRTTTGARDTLTATTCRRCSSNLRRRRRARGRDRELDRQEANLDDKATMRIKEMVELITADYIDFERPRVIVSKEDAGQGG